MSANGSTGGGKRDGKAPKSGAPPASGGHGRKQAEEEGEEEAPAAGSGGGAKSKKRSAAEASISGRDGGGQEDDDGGSEGGKKRKSKKEARRGASAMEEDWERGRDAGAGLKASDRKGKKAESAKRGEASGQEASGVKGREERQSKEAHAEAAGVPAAGTTAAAKPAREKKSISDKKAASVILKGAEEAADPSASPTPAAGSGAGAGAAPSTEPRPPPTAEEQAEKLSRTVFVGNVPVASKTIKRRLTELFSKHIGGGEVESVRLRSLPLDVSSKGNRKAKAMQGMIDKQRATGNAYVVFKDVASVEKALEANMEKLGEFHIRVDKATAPSKKGSKPSHASTVAASAAAEGGEEGSPPSSSAPPSATVYDPARSLFIGNVHFETRDEEIIRLFSDENVAPELKDAVEAVRLVRDPATNFGKGFGFVLFRSKAAARVALYHQEWILRKRVLRITRVSGAPTQGGGPGSRNPPPAAATGFKARHDPTRGRGGPGPASNERGGPARSSAPGGDRDVPKAKKAMKADWQGVQTKGKAKGVRGPKEAKPSSSAASSGKPGGGGAAKPSAAAAGGKAASKRDTKRPTVANRKLKAKGLPLKAIPADRKGSKSRGRGSVRGRGGGGGGKKPGGRR